MIELITPRHRIAGEITVMKRFTQLFCNLMVSGFVIGVTAPAFAGPPPCGGVDDVIARQVFFRERR